MQVRVGGSLLPLVKSLEQSTGPRRLSNKEAKTPPLLLGWCGLNWLLITGS